MVDYAAARMNMADSQLRTNKVSDPTLLDAFEKVPRELFVPAGRGGVAYVDKDIALGGGRYLLEPMVLARLLQEARPGPTEIALDVGCGTGYSTAILARLVATVVALESDHDLATRASRTLADLGIDNAMVVEGPLPAGWRAQAPYGVILINGAVADVPAALRAQLAEGGRLVTVQRTGPGPGRGLLMRRNCDVTAGRVVFDAGTPVIPEFERAAEFVF